MIEAWIPPKGLSARERARLVWNHDELRTISTLLRSHVELVRIELRGPIEPMMRQAVLRHLAEMELALGRLHSLAVQLRTWHDDESGETPTSGGVRVGAEATFP